MDIVSTDLTTEYGSTLQRWLEATSLREAEIRRALGDEQYDEKAGRRKRTAAAIDEGLLSRFQYTAARA